MQPWIGINCSFSFVVATGVHCAWIHTNDLCSGLVLLAVSAESFRAAVVLYITVFSRHSVAVQTTVFGGEGSAAGIAAGLVRFSIVLASGFCAQGNQDGVGITWVK